MSKRTHCGLAALVMAVTVPVGGAAIARSPEPPSAAPAAAIDPQVTAVLDAAAEAVGGRQRLATAMPYVAHSQAGPMDALLYVGSESRWAMVAAGTVPGSGSSPKFVDDYVTINRPDGGREQIKVKAWDPGTAPIEHRFFMAEAGGHAVISSTLKVEIDTPAANLMRTMARMYVSPGVPTAESISRSGASAAFVGPAKFQGSDVVAIDLSGPGFKMRMAFDTTSKRPVGHEIEYLAFEMPDGSKQDMKAETKFTGWAEIEGLSYPSKMETTSATGPGGSQTLTILSVGVPDEAVMKSVESQFPQAVIAKLREVRAQPVSADSPELHSWREFFAALLPMQPEPRGETAAPAAGNR